MTKLVAKTDFPAVAPAGSEGLTESLADEEGRLPVIDDAPVPTLVVDMDGLNREKDDCDVTAAVDADDPRLDTTADVAGTV